MIAYPATAGPPAPHCYPAPVHRCCLYSVIHETAVAGGVKLVCRNPQTVLSSDPRLYRTFQTPLRRTHTSVTLAALVPQHYCLPTCSQVLNRLCAWMRWPSSCYGFVCLDELALIMLRDLLSKNRRVRRNESGALIVVADRCMLLLSGASGKLGCKGSKVQEKKVANKKSCSGASGVQLRPTWRNPGRSTAQRCCRLGLSRARARGRPKQQLLLGGTKGCAAPCAASGRARAGRRAATACS